MNNEMTYPIEDKHYIICWFLITINDNYSGVMYGYLDMDLYKIVMDIFRYKRKTYTDDIRNRINDFMETHRSAIKSEWKWFEYKILDNSSYDYKNLKIFE